MADSQGDATRRQCRKNLAVQGFVLLALVGFVCFLDHMIWKHAPPHEPELIPRSFWPVLVGFLLFVGHAVFLRRRGRLILGKAQTPVESMGPRKTRIAIVLCVVAFGVFGMLRDRYPYESAMVLVAVFTWILLWILTEIGINILVLRLARRAESVRGSTGAGECDARSE